MARAGLLLALLVATSGCALIINRPTQPLQVDSDPGGAVAALDGERCVTPCELRAPRSHDAVVTLSKEGREPAAVVFRSRLRETTLLNLIFGPPGLLLGIPIDVATGAAYELYPPYAVIPLAPATSGAPGDVRPLRELAPLRRPRFAFDVELGMGGLTWDESLLLQAGALATWQLRGPFVAGAVVDAAAGVGMGDVAGVATFAAVGGVAVTPSRSSRLVALLLAGLHRYADGPGDVLAGGGHVQWTAVFGDGFTLGVYGRYLEDLDRRGGGTFFVGYTMGGLWRERDARASPLVTPSAPPPPPAPGPR